MDKMCQKCGAPMVFKQAGVSQKTGKPYNSFWACSTGERTHTENVTTTAQLEPSPQGGIPQTATGQNVNRPIVKSPEQLVAEAKENQAESTLQIIRQSALKSMAVVVAASVNHPDNLGKTIPQLTEDLIRGANLLVKFVYLGPEVLPLQDSEVITPEEVLEEDLNKLPF